MHYYTQRMFEQIVFTPPCVLETYQIQSTYFHGEKNNSRVYTSRIITFGRGCSKLTTSLANISLKFQTLIL